MIKLDTYDLNFCVNRLPKKLFDLMKSKEWSSKIFVGGGFIRGIIAGEKLNDVDVFAQSAGDTGLLSGLLAERPTDIIKTANAYTIKTKLPIQIIHRWLFEKPENVSDSFDFTVCCAVIFFDGTKWDSHCCDRFYIDLSSKRLVYRSPARNEDAGGSMLRVLKYYQRGYRIPLDSLGSVISRLVKNVDEESIVEGMRVNQVTREQQMAKVITGLLREVDPNIDPNHFSHLPSMEETGE